LQVTDRLIFYCCVNETGADGVIMAVALHSDLLAQLEECYRMLQNYVIIAYIQLN
jgi:hypothetical protein